MKPSPWSFLIGFLGMIACASAQERSFDRPLSPEDEQATFRLHDANLEIELIAAEPQVDSPVAISWDADGKMFVAEMSDYPMGPEKGRIRVLEDRDQDGRYEYSHVFADDIAFPTGVMPSRGGVLVTSAPDILYLRDSDGDGKADVRQVLLTGFGEGNQQLRVNSLLWGADNWIYGANGRSDGDIRRPEDPPEKAVSIRGRDFRFRPDGTEFQAVTGQSQFGLARNDWGERFCSWNTIALRHALLPQYVLEAHPQFSDQACRDIADSADNTRIFPISPQPQTFNKESTRFYNALCGLTIFRGDALGAKYSGNAFVCESLMNLVHRRTLVSAGPTFISMRAVPDAEFLASTDPWFHPVFLAAGPDGALYLADFYRRWVEHPQWVADVHARTTTDWRQGASHGRIWRIRRREEKTVSSGNRLQSLEKADIADLVTQLNSSNGWRRDTAQRLLVERQDRSARPLLVNLVRTGEAAISRFHALGTLAGVDGLDPQLLAETLKDPAPQVRRQCIRLAMPMIAGSRELQLAVFQAAGDADLQVRFEVAIALGGSEGSENNSAVERLLAACDGSTWDAVVLQLAMGRSAWNFLHQLLEANSRMLEDPSTDHEKLLANLGRLVGQHHDDSEVAACFKRITPLADAKVTPGALAVLSGLAQGLADEGLLVRQLRVSTPDNLKDSFQSLPKLTAAACATALLPSEKLQRRLLAVRVLTFAGSVDEVRAVLPLADASTPQPIASAAITAISIVADSEMASELFANWGAYSTHTRTAIPAASLRSSVASRALIEAVEAGVLTTLEIDATTRDALLQTHDTDLAKRAEQVLAAAVPADREKVLVDFHDALTLPGNRQRGAKLITEHCLTCHQILGRGRRTGPDLSGIGSHPKEQLLVSLLDPGRQVSPDYLAYLLETTDGQILSGLIVGETATAITLRGAEGNDETIPRNRIERLRASGKSLMPDGLEQKLSKQDIADVLEFIVHPDAALLDNSPQR